MALLPYGVQGVELLLPRREEVRVVRTSLHVAATPAEAWNAIMFYEEVRHDPPWISRPWVITVEGRTSAMGRVLRCLKCEARAPRDR